MKTSIHSDKTSKYICKTIMIIFFCFLFFARLEAISNNPFNLPATIPVPQWVYQIDWSKPNVYKIDSCIAVYSEQEKKGESNEEPYEGAYIRWRNHIAPFIKGDGSILYDSTYYNKILQQAISNQNSTKKDNKLQEEYGNWTPLGPIETFWSSNSGKSCEQVNIYQIAIAPSNPSILYCVSETGVIFKSLDKGLNWISVSDNLPAIAPTALVVDPKSENIVYCYANGYSLLKSIDGGANWSLLSSYIGEGGERIIINPETGRIIISGASSIYYSDDAGLTWIQSKGSTIIGYYYDLILNPLNSDIIYAVGSSNESLIMMMRSSDGGLNFTTVTDGLAGIENKGARFGVSKANSYIVYCISLGFSVGPKLLKSYDRGISWTVVAESSNLSLTGGGKTEGLDMSNGQGFFDLDIIIDPLNVDNVIMGTTTTYKSTDGGINFSPLGGYNGTFGIHVDLQCTRAFGNETYLATDGGVNYSSDFFTDLSNWSIRNKGLTGSDFWGFGQGWDEDIVVGGRYHNGNTAICDFYNNGQALALGGGEDATGHVFHGKERTVGYRDIGTYVIPTDFFDPLKPAEIQNRLWPQDDYYGLFSSKLVFDPTYSNIFYLGKDSTLWKSSNNGSSYIALHNFGNGNRVWRFDIARSNPDVIYVCANNGVYKTSDAGTTWNQLTLPTGYYFYNTDIVVNPVDDNEIYLCIPHNPATDKVLKSSDGGVTWDNITGTALNNSTVSYLQYQGGTNGGIYAITSSNYTATKVYYRDNSMNDWINFSKGLKQNYYARCGGLIFYRDSKIRLAGSRGIWESPLYSTGTPVAQPMADKKYIACSKDTVRFYDYSMVNYSGVSRQWSFPGAAWVSDSTSKNPKVLYPAIGNYSVALKVTDKLGKSDSKTIKDMIIFNADNCSPDTLAGKCILLTGTNQKYNLGKVNINSNTFSLSCWIKPNGNQNSFAQILSHYGCPGSPGYGLGLGFTFSGYTPNLMLCYTDETVNYGNYSGLVCDSTQWNFVVLTYSPSEVKIYLNGVSAVVNSGNIPVLDLSQSPFYINADIHGQNGTYKGLIDEIKFYNYSLSQDEVREKMHLIQDNPQSESGLIKYFQFNKYDQVSESAYDVIGGSKTDIPSVNVIESTAPVSTGTYDRKSLVNGPGKYNFTNADLDLFLPANGVYPDGELLAFHLRSNPDQKPDTNSIVPGYFIINNYGTNKNFTKPDSIRFGNLKINSLGYNPNNFDLYKRPAGAFGSSWENRLDSASSLKFKSNNSILTWTRCDSLTSFGQFVIVNKNEIPVGIIQKPIQANNNSVISELYPNPAAAWVKLDVDSRESKILGISVITLDGSSVINFTDEIKIGKNTILINLQSLSKGIYIIRIRLQSENEVVRKLTIE
ncbi:MAG: LamG-like jellyroll fold domain-containing protein [bacterium]